MNKIVPRSDDLLPDADVAGHSEIGNFEGTIGDFGVLTLRSGYFCFYSARPGVTSSFGAIFLIL